MAAILACFLSVGLLWAARVPTFEKPDEIAHFAYSRFLAHERRLPIQGRETAAFLEPETQQPPTHYVITAAVLAVAWRLGVPATDPADWTARVNPNGPAGSARPMTSHAFFLPAPQLSGQLWGTLVPADLLAARLVSLVFGAATVAVTYRCASSVFAQRRVPLIAAAAVAFLPQFGFITTSASNDALAFAAGSVLLWVLLRVRRSTPEAFVRWSAALGLGLGGAVLIKASLYTLFPLIVLARPSGISNGRWLRGLTVAAVLAVLVGGPWIGRNARLYGDPLARQEVISPHMYAWNLSPKSISSPYFRGPFWSETAQSFVGSFGFNSVRLHWVLYAAAAVLVSAAGVGGLRRLRNGRGKGPELLILAGAPALALAGTAFYNLQVDQPQGRYLFHTLAALGALFGWGMMGLVPGSVRRLEATVVAAFIALAVWLNLYLTLRLLPFVYG